MSIRPKKVDRLAEADAIISKVLTLFEDAIEDLWHADELSNAEWDGAAESIKQLQDRQRRAEEHGARAARIRLRLRAPID